MAVSCNVVNAPFAACNCDQAAVNNVDNVVPAKLLSVCWICRRVSYQRTEPGPGSSYRRPVQLVSKHSVHLAEDKSDVIVGAPMCGVTENSHSSQHMYACACGRLYCLYLHEWAGHRICTLKRGLRVLRGWQSCLLWCVCVRVAEKAVSMSHPYLGSNVTSPGESVVPAIVLPSQGSR